MKKILNQKFRISHALSHQAFNDLLARAERVFEQDRYGIKVALLDDGTIVKVFRVKRWWSGAGIYSYARRFCRNVERLRLLGIPVPEVVDLYHVVDSNLSVVHYLPLEGKTIKDLLKEDMLNEVLAEEIGRFIAKIHSLGVYFRGLHIGNIVRTPNGELGLIDVSELSIYWRLSRYRRLRNFARFWRTRDDQKSFGVININQLITGYVKNTNNKSIKANDIFKRLN
jgi:hypothetical protein